MNIWIFLVFSEKTYKRQCQNWTIRREPRKGSGQGRSESLLGTFWIAKVAKCLHTDYEDSDQTAQMLTLIWVLFGVDARRYVFSDYRSYAVRTHWGSSAVLKSSNIFMGVFTKYFSYFSLKKYVVSTQWKCLSEALLISIHKICFHGEIRKISFFFFSVEKKVLICN